MDTDKLFYKEVGAMDKPLIRRGLLSMLSSMYDPLSVVSLFIFRAMCVMQKLCRVWLG